METFDLKKKRKKLKDNIDVCLARQVNKQQDTTGKKVTEKQKRKMRKSWEKSAERVDNTKLAEVWNPKKPSAIDDSKRPMLGTYFGGVNFDKEGNIIR